MNGVVEDPSGAAIPGASVVLTNVATGVKRTTETDSAGDYVFVNIIPSRYTIEASKLGFSSVAQQEFTLYVNQTATFNFTLPVGSTRQMVTVQAAGSRVEASTAELGSVVDTRQANDLPLNGRNFSQLLQLSPGASPVNIAQNAFGWGISPLGTFSFPSMNGQRNRSNLFLLDGGNDQAAYVSEYAIPPIMDDVQEFKVQSHNDDSEFGQVPGGVIDVVTKSGTNAFHGDAWEFVRNTAFDSRNFFVPNVTPLHQNQFGGTLGGPIILPHYNGRDRTFFFAAYEGFRDVTPSETVYLVPTPAELSGDLSGLGTTVYNPFSTRPDPNKPGQYIRDPFPNNQIPQNLLNPTAEYYARTLFPAPINTGVPGTNGRDTTPTATRQDEPSLRLDEQIGTNDSLFVRYTGLAQTIFGSGGYKGLRAESYFHAYQLSSSWTHTFGGNAVVQLMFSRNSNQSNSNNTYISAPPNFLQQAGFQPNWVTFKNGYTAIPLENMPGYLNSTGGEYISDGHFSDVYEWKGDLSKIQGRHILRTGADFTLNPFQLLCTSSNSVYSPYETSNLEAGTGGSTLASFLLGIPDSSEKNNTYKTLYSSWIDGAYFQDQWKVTDKLTLNLGLRYDVTLIPPFGSNKDGNNMVGDYNFNYGTYILQRIPPPCSSTQGAPCLPGGTAPAHVIVSPNGKIINNSYDNWQPRLGLAYALTPTTVLRAGFGRFFDNWAAINQIDTNLGGNWPDVANLSLADINPTVPTALINDPLHLGTGVIYPSPFPNEACQCPDPNWENTLSNQWNLGIQKQLNLSTILTANYVGSEDSRVSVGAFYNTALQPGTGPPQSRAPWPYFPSTPWDRPFGTASYNALQFSLDRKTSHGLSYLLSYTWSKAMDECGGFFEQGCNPENPYNLKNERAVDDANLPNIFSLSWVYALPFGRAGKWVSGNRALNYLAAGWQVNGILSLSNGQVYETVVPGDIANIGNGFYERMDLTGQPLNPPQQTLTNWFNKAAFAVPAPFTFGNEGRNMLQADWRRNMDFSVFREFPLPFGELTKLEFRAEAFNLANIPVFGPPDGNFSDPTYGDVLSTANTQREIQFGLKLYW
ncbi:MAG: TonB-dependent receptor domain-containing protein [Terriglobia bacterium]